MCPEITFCCWSPSASVSMRLKSMSRAFRCPVIRSVNPVSALPMLRSIRSDAAFKSPIDSRTSAKRQNQVCRCAQRLTGKGLLVAKSSKREAHIKWLDKMADSSKCDFVTVCMKVIKNVCSVSAFSIPRTFGVPLLTNYTAVIDGKLLQQGHATLPSKIHPYCTADIRSVLLTVLFKFKSPSWDDAHLV